MQLFSTDLIAKDLEEWQRVHRDVHEVAVKSSRFAILKLEDGLGQRLSFVGLEGVTNHTHQLFNVSKPAQHQLSQL